MCTSPVCTCVYIYTYVFVHGQNDSNGVCSQPGKMSLVVLEFSTWHTKKQVMCTCIMFQCTSSFQLTYLKGEHTTVSSVTLLWDFLQTYMYKCMSISSSTPLYHCITYSHPLNNESPFAEVNCTTFLLGSFLKKLSSKKRC